MESWICSASSRVGVTIRARVRLRGPLNKFLQNWQDEHRRLTGAGLGGGDQVLASQGGGEGGSLDGGGLGIAEPVDPRLQARIKVELIKAHDIPFLQKSGGVGEVERCSNKQQQRLLK